MLELEGGGADGGVDVSLGEARGSNFHGISSILKLIFIRFGVDLKPFLTSKFGKLSLFVRGSIREQVFFHFLQGCHLYLSFFYYSGFTTNI